MESLKEYLKKTLIPQIIAWLQRLIIEKKTNNYKPISLESLTPTCDSDDDNIYKSALKNALDNSNNYNIGITGAYGSGKSSILESFIKNHESDYHFLKISLASFNENNLTEIDNKSNTINPIKDGDNLNKIGNTNVTKSVNEKPLPDDDTLHKVNQLIELSILQQLLYHVKIKEIPNSRFNRIKRHRPQRILGSAVLVFIWLLSIIFITEPNFLKVTTLWNDLNWNNNSNYFVIPSLLLFTLGCVILISQLIRFATDSKLSKFNLKDGEIEVNRPDDRSILNRYLDEVLYFFEMTKHNVIIIEDLDRLKNSMIFTKLRELNILLNNSDQIKKSVGRIVFIYALRDDLFKDKSRTKFFDVIIPVIPIINNLNSGAKFLGMLDKVNSSHNLSKDIINDIFPFIGDMRLLKNIYNEYVIYKEKIKKVPDQNKLLAMIVYKNIFPAEFVALHSRIGTIYRVLKSEKSLLIEKRIENIDKRIIEINTKIRDIEEILSENETELRASYINALWKKVPNEAHAIIINGEQFEYSQLSDLEVFEKLLTYGASNYWTPQLVSNPVLSINFKDIEKELPFNRTYNERLELLSLKKQNEINRLREIIEGLNKDKTIARSQSIAEIANNQDLSETFLELKEPHNRLIQLLLRKGYIDENFDVYISFFHPGSLTNDDQDFVMSVKCTDALDFGFTLTNKKEIISQLNVSDFGQKEILNIDLLDFLISNRKSYDIQLGKIFDQLTNESQRSVKFIDAYIDGGQQHGYFIEQLCQKWQNIWNYVELISNFSNQRKDKYLVLIVKYAMPESIEKINKENRFADYIIEQPHFISLISDEDTEKAKDVIINLNIIFTQLKTLIYESKLFEFIYENERYVINHQMIEVIVQNKGIKLNNISNLLERKNFSTVRMSKCDHLLKYLNKNINYYIENVCLKLEKNKDENEESILELLNNENLKVELKKKIILNNTIKLLDLSKVKDKELYAFIAENSKMVPIWENIYTYLEIVKKEQSSRTLKTIDDPLSLFLNQKANYEELSKKKISSLIEKDESLIKSLCDRIVFCQSITINSFKSLHKSIPFSYTSLSDNSISEEKIDYMISSGFLSFTTNNFEFLRNYYSPKHIKQLEIKRNDFINSIEKFKLRGNDVLLIIKSNAFNETQKIIVIKSIKAYLLYSEKYACNAICEFLVDKNYVDLPLKLIESLFKSGTNDIDKIKLFNLLLNGQLTEFNSITSLLLAIGYPYSKLTKKGIKQKILSRKENKTFVEHLKRLDYNIRSTLTIGGYINIHTKKE